MKSSPLLLGNRFEKKKISPVRRRPGLSVAIRALAVEHLLLCLFFVPDLELEKQIRFVEMSHLEGFRRSSEEPLQFRFQFASTCFASRRRCRPAWQRRASCRAHRWVSRNRERVLRTAEIIAYGFVGRPFTDSISHFLANYLLQDSNSHRPAMCPSRLVALHVLSFDLKPSAIGTRGVRGRQRHVSYPGRRPVRRPAARAQACGRYRHDLPGSGGNLGNPVDSSRGCRWPGPASRLANVVKHAFATGVHQRPAVAEE